MHSTPSQRYCTGVWHFADVFHAGPGRLLMMLGFGAKQAAGTTVFIVTFVSVSGFAAHAAEGRVEPLLAILTVIAALAGSQLGAWFMAKRAKPGWVKRLYGVLLAGVASKLMLDIVRE